MSRNLRAAARDIMLGVLTNHERDVLQSLGKGYPNTIAYDLGIPSRTIEVHLAKIMTELRALSLSEVLRVAFAGSLGEDRP